MRTTLRAVVGWIWLAGPLALLAFHIWYSTQVSFIRLSYYVVVWGSLLALAVCGFWFLIYGPGAKWLLRAAAVAVTLFVALNFLIAWDYGGRQGNHDFLLYSVLAGVVAFCIVSIAVAGMQPNSTPHTDARTSTVTNQSSPAARAGGRGR
jgi:hypothetical protein